MTTIRDTDLFLINRDGESYQVTAETVQNDIGYTPTPGIDPTPTDVFASPNFQGGNGSEAFPYVLSPGNSFLNGELYSEEEITLVNQLGNTSAFFEDLNVAENGNRFNQPPLSTNSQGTLVFRIRYIDTPTSPSTSPTYTGLLKIGSVYFTWDVTVENRGVGKPSIQTITGLNGSATAPPTFPSFTSPPSVPAALFWTTNYTGLNANQEIVANASGGSGQDLQCTLKTNPSGQLLEPIIYNAGTGYENGEQVLFDTSSIGGGPVSAYLYTNPLTATTFIADISAYQTTFGGAFAKNEWIFSSSKDFDTGSETTWENTDPATSLTVPHGQPGNQLSYAKFRNVSVDDIESPYCDVVQFVTGNNVTLNYDLTDFTASPKSFNSGDVTVVAFPGTVYAVNRQSNDLNPFGNSSGGSGGSDRGSCCTGAGGSGIQVMASVQTRQEVAFKVLTINGTGGVTGVEQVKNGFGAPDYMIDETSNTAAPLTGGSGSGCEILLQRDDDNYSVFKSIKAAGSNYQVNDILTVTPPYGTGNGNIRDMDSAWDILLNGLAGRGGGGAGGEGSGGGNSLTPVWSGSVKGNNGGSNRGAAGGTGGNGGTASGALYGEKGANGGNRAGTGGGGGGGGGGWGGGSGGGGGRDAGSDVSSGGGGGGSGYSYVNPLLTGYSTSNTTFGSTGYILRVNGNQVGNGTAANLTTIDLSD